MNKSYVLLRMYDKLRSEKPLRINEACTEYEISVSTFRRYMAFLRGYFGEIYGQEIVYDAVTAKYFLKLKE